MGWDAFEREGHFFGLREGAESPGLTIFKEGGEMTAQSAIQAASQ